MQSLGKDSSGPGLASVDGARLSASSVVTDLRKKDFELALMTFVSRRLPPIRGSMRVAKEFAAFYNRNPRPPVISRVRDFEMLLDPAEYVDRNLLFCPHLYDRWEVAQIERYVRPGQTALDLGAHIGTYSLVLSGQVGPGGKVFAFEAWSPTYQRLLRNLELNSARNVFTRNVGLSDISGPATFWIFNQTGDTNSGGNCMVLWEGSAHLFERTTVDCTTLIDAIANLPLERIDFMKIDIESMEFRVLKHFLTHAERRLYPRMILAEDHAGSAARAGGSLPDLLAGYGYRQLARSPRRSEPNFIFVLNQ